MMCNLHFQGNDTGKAEMAQPAAKKPKPNPTAASMNDEALPGSYPMGISRKLQSLNVTNYTRVLSKTLERTDLSTCESRLLLTSKKVEASPLSNILTETERALIHEKDGLPVRTFDRLGREYNMVFKFLKSNRAYRMIRGWSRFLRENDGNMRVGDEIEIWAFRIPKTEGTDHNEVGMALLLHHEKDDGDSFHVVDRDGEEDEHRDVRPVERERCLRVQEEKMKVSPDEWIAVEGLMELKWKEKNLKMKDPLE